MSLENKRDCSPKAVYRIMCNAWRYTRQRRFRHKGAHGMGQAQTFLFSRREEQMMLKKGSD
jgi:hypothetical protein